MFPRILSFVTKNVFKKIQKYIEVLKCKLEIMLRKRKNDGKI